jgi:hypothetical protein
MSDIVYAEICVHFTAQRDCDAFFSENRIRVEPLTREAHFSGEPDLAPLPSQRRKNNPHSR